MSCLAIWMRERAVMDTYYYEVYILRSICWHGSAKGFARTIALFVGTLVQQGRAKAARNVVLRSIYTMKNLYSAVHSREGFFGDGLTQSHYGL